MRFFSLDSRISDGNEAEEAPSFSDFGVLFRLSRMASDVIKAMNDHGIPYQLVGEEPFYKQEPICTLMDILRFVAQPSNRVLLERLMDKKVKGLSESSLLSMRGNDTLHSPEAYIREIVATYLPDLKVTHADAVDRLIALSNDCGPHLSSFLSLVQLGSGIDAYNPAAEQVSLMTIHAAKGLEFSYVFIMGCEDGILPFTLFSKDKIDGEEERRLLYVGMTRAEKMLFLSHAKKRNLYGRTLSPSVSPFLRTIREELIARSSPEKAVKREKNRQLSLFP